MGTYVRYPCAHTTKKPLPTVGGFLERLVKRDANPASVIATDTGSIPETEARSQKAPTGSRGLCLLSACVCMDTFGVLDHNPTVFHSLFNVVQLKWRAVGKRGNAIENLVPSFGDVNVYELRLARFSVIYLDGSERAVPGSVAVIGNPRSSRGEFYAELVRFLLFAITVGSGGDHVNRSSSFFGMSYDASGHGVVHRPDLFAFPFNPVHFLSL